MVEERWRGGEMVEERDRWSDGEMVGEREAVWADKFQSHSDRWERKASSERKSYIRSDGGMYGSAGEGVEMFVLLQDSATA